ncbi:transposase [Empedobacter brevis]|uniref:transposase n=1 Tax=Empedobacter brevis TaxID=247 RepID=UPI003B8A93DA
MYADLISEIHKQNRYTYGSPHITEELKRKGYCISIRRLANKCAKKAGEAFGKRDSGLPFLSCQQKSCGT